MAKYSDLEEQLDGSTSKGLDTLGTEDKASNAMVQDIESTVSSAFTADEAVLDPEVADNARILAVESVTRVAGENATAMGTGYSGDQGSDNVQTLASAIQVGHGKSKGTDVDSLLGTEAFSKTKLGEIKVLSAMTTHAGAIQNSFDEAWYPVKRVNSGDRGIAMVATVESSVVSTTRSLDGSPDFRGVNKIPLIKGQYDGAYATGNLLRCVPVLRADTEKYLLKDITREVIIEGNKILTSPIKTGVEVSLISLSASASKLALGGATNAEELEGIAALEALYVQLGTGVDGDPIETFRLDTRNLAGVNFNPTNSGSVTSLQLSFSTDSGFTIVAGANVKTATNEVSAIFAAIPAGTVVNINVKVTGGIDNLQDSTTDVNSIKVSLNSVTSTDGLTETSGATYDTVNAYFALGEVTGYDINANRTNGDLAETGRTYESDAFRQPFDIPFGSPISTNLSLVFSKEANKQAIIDGHIAKLRVTNSIAKTENLLAWVETVKNAHASYLVSGASDLGILATKFLKPWHDASELTISSDINSISTTDRKNEIGEYLRNRILDVANRAYVESGYNLAFDALAKGSNQNLMPIVLVATDAYTASWIADKDGKFECGAFEGQVVINSDPRFKNNLVGTFKLPKGAAEAANIIDSGFTGMAADITVPLKRVKGAGTVETITTLPRSKSYNLLPVIFEMSHDSFTDALKRV